MSQVPDTPSDERITLGLVERTERRADRFNLRLTAAEKTLIAHAARASGVSASHFIVQAAVRAAEDAVARQNRFVLPAGQWAEFAAMLDRPARDIEALREAAKKPRPFVEP